MRSPVAAAGLSVAAVAPVATRSNSKCGKIKFKNPANYLGGTVFEFLLATSSSVSSSSSSSLSLGVIISPLTIPARIFNEAGRAGGGVATTPPDRV